MAILLAVGDLYYLCSSVFICGIVFAAGLPAGRQAICIICVYLRLSVAKFSPQVYLPAGRRSVFISAISAIRGLICGMEISFNTPALLFPAISLLLLAYTNRFLALASLVRKLHDEYTSGQQNKILLRQIHSLRRRINLIRYMQGLGVFSFLCCVASMYSIYKGWGVAAEYIFALSLLSLLSSLIFSLIEIIQSTNAIELELSDIEELEKSNIFTDLISRKGDGGE